MAVLLHVCCCFDRLDRGQERAVVPLLHIRRETLDTCYHTMCVRARMQRFVLSAVKMASSHRRRLPILSLQVCGTIRLWT